MTDAEYEAFCRRKFHWIHWPRTRQRHYMLPWYVIAWRFPFFCVFQILRLAICFIAVCMGGASEARQCWRNFQ